MFEMEKLIWAIGGTVLMVLIAIGFGIFAFYHHIGQKLDKASIDKLARDRQDVQDRLDEAIRIVHIGALSGGTSQYLNRIMLAITGLVGMIAEDNSNIDNMRSLATAASKEALEGLKITDQMQQLSFASKIRLDELSINEVIEIAVARGRLHNAVLSHDVSELAGHTGKILGNALFLERLIDLVLINASDATAESGATTISIKIHDAQTLWVTITDTGVGMDVATQLQATDPFFSKHKRVDRLGLGLSYALALVKIHDGVMDFNSTLGKGCEVTLKFPIASQVKLIENAEKAFGLEEVIDRPQLSLEQELNLVRYEMAQA